MPAAPAPVEVRPRTPSRAPSRKEIQRAVERKAARQEGGNRIKEPISISRKRHLLDSHKHGPSRWRAGRLTTQVNSGSRQVQQALESMATATLPADFADVAPPPTTATIDQAQPTRPDGTPITPQEKPKRGQVSSVLKERLLKRESVGGVIILPNRKNGLTEDQAIQEGILNAIQQAHANGGQAEKDNVRAIAQVALENGISYNETREALRKAGIVEDMVVEEWFPEEAQIARIEEIKMKVIQREKELRQLNRPEEEINQNREAAYNAFIEKELARGGALEALQKSAQAKGAVRLLEAIQKIQEKENEKAQQAEKNENIRALINERFNDKGQADQQIEEEMVEAIARAGEMTADPEAKLLLERIDKKYTARQRQKRGETLTAEEQAEISFQPTFNDRRRSNQILREVRRQKELQPDEAAKIRLQVLTVSSSDELKKLWQFYYKRHKISWGNLGFSLVLSFFQQVFKDFFG